MKSYEQRTENIKSKAKSISARRKAWISVAACACCVAIVCGVLFAPIIQDNPPSIDAYRQSDYFPLIEKISAYNEKYYSGNSSIWNEIDLNVPIYGATAPGDTSAPTSPSEGSTSTPPTSNKYEETTMNQVAGVTEGDILKRSTNHAFYLKSVWENENNGKSHLVHKVSAYKLQGKASALVGEYLIKPQDGTTFVRSWSAPSSTIEMYLSEDVQTLTVLASCENGSGVYYTCVVSLDVSDPSNITENARSYVAGKYLSSRKVKGELLIVTNFYVPRKPNYDNPECFIPSCGAMDAREYWKMDEIYCPDYVSDCAYTVAVKMNESDLAVTSKQAVLSYAYDMAVSTEHIFVIRNRYQYEQDGQPIDLREAKDGPVSYKTFAEIVCLEYADELKNVGCVQLDGTVKDRYCLDEKDGILRAVTNTHSYWYQVGDYWSKYGDEIRSVSLHCVDLDKMEVVAGVSNFAPKNDTVQAVRYDGNVAYVCTAVRNTDPVFVFDLSDISNITYKDTGTIPGYSINLLKFGDNLLGIGYGESRNTLKIEVFAERESDVTGIAQFTIDFCTFSEEYKAHFVDAERQLVGLQIIDYNTPSTPKFYLLLQFDGTQFNVLVKKQVYGDNGLARAFYDGGFYLFTDVDGASIYFFGEDELFGQSNG